MIDRNYDDWLTVGIAQTQLDYKEAWPCSTGWPAISGAEDARAWGEICRAMRAFQDEAQKPRLILFPELCLPRTRLEDFEHLVSSLNVIAVVGVDYRLRHAERAARNEGVVFVPRNLFRDYPSRHCSRIVFGKTYPSPREHGQLRAFSPPWAFLGDHSVYVFDCDRYGCFGVSICYDFMDIERALMYRARIQHLFVLAYNRDVEAFRSLAVSLCRTVFCNVVVCNTGHFGGSLVVSPYYEPWKRTLYSHDGSRLFTSQVVRLPVRSLIQAQRGAVENVAPERTGVPEFKDLPPGFRVGKV